MWVLVVIELVVSGTQCSRDNNNAQFWLNGQN